MPKLYGVEAKSGQRRFNPDWDFLDAAQYARYFHYSLISEEAGVIAKIIDVEDWGY